MHIIFTRRTDDVGSHKGQISFPGGHRDEKESAIEAAVRECREELLVGYDFAKDKMVESFEDENGLVCFPPNTDNSFNDGSRWNGELKVLGVCHKIPAITGTTVTPIIGILPNIIPSTITNIEDYFSPNKSEVAQVFSRSISQLLEAEDTETYDKGPGGMLKWDGPIYPGDGGQIWGLTAIILKPILQGILKEHFR